MTATANHMKDIYKKLSRHGFKRPFITSVLPEWWDDDIAASPSGLQQASLVLGRVLGVKPESLWAQDSALQLSIPSEKKFKRRADTSEDACDIACAIAHAVARIVLRGYKRPFRGDLLEDPSELRTRLLEKKPWVGLSGLLGYCAEVGIPVIYLCHFPAGARKMAGLAFETAGRPVIVLTQPNKYGFMLFDLAHELGHVSLGHVAGDRWVVDGKIDHDAEDEDEKSANRYALELLTASPDCRIVPAGRNLTGEQLATAAERYGRQNQVDPMHVALNYGYSTRHFPAAQIAVTQLAGGKPTDQQLATRALFDEIDEEALGADDLTVLQRYCGFKEQ
jgi:hypothetical protein